MSFAAVPLVAETAVASTLTAAEITAAAQAAAAAEAAAAAQTATNASILNTITTTPVSSAAGATTAAGTGAGAGGAGGLADLTVNLSELPASSWEELATEMPEGIESNFGGDNPISPSTTPAPPPAAPVQTATLPQVGPPAAPPPAAPPPPPIETAFTHPNPDQVERLKLLAEADAGPLEKLLPPEPPPTVPESLNQTYSDVAQQVDPAGGFDNPGFDSADYARAQGYRTGVDPLNTVISSSGGAPLTGIDMLAKEVGAMPGVQSTLTQYGAGAPVSTPLTSATPFNPAAPMANPTYAQPSGLQGLQTNLSGPLGSNLTPSVTNAVTSAGTDATSQQAVYAPPGGTQMRDVVAKDAVEWAGGNANQIASAATPAATPEAGGLQGLWKDFTGMSLKDKALTGLMASSAYQMMNQPKPYEKPKYKSTWNGSNYTGYQPVQPTPYQPNYAHGGLADLGGYSDYARGGRMLKGPGDGMSDDIPATIANKQPARLANEEFVVPADVVSHLGNGSSEAGAKVLYKMMDRVRRARTGSKKQGKQINPEKYLA